MPFRIRSRKNSRKDPSKRAGTRDGGVLQRSGRIRIGSRIVKAGRGVILSDEALVANIARIRGYRAANLIDVKVLPGTSSLALSVFEGEKPPESATEPPDSGGVDIDFKPEAVEPTVPPEVKEPEPVIEAPEPVPEPPAPKEPEVEEPAPAPATVKRVPRRASGRRKPKVAKPQE